ncbi:MAG: hypothetical protein KZQ80_03725 [Candidatus Thiodiazotropha sp. (ex Monitilora ramsayi)]|nr:hypothetical protein [Candidatus Thiodiazotropha sp. (ex Monitilora ramsayi)]
MNKNPLAFTLFFLVGCASYDVPHLDLISWVELSTKADEKWIIDYAMPRDSLFEDNCMPNVVAEDGKDKIRFCFAPLGYMPSAYGHIIFLEYWYGHPSMNQYDSIIEVNGLNWKMKKGFSNSGTPYAWAFTRLGGNRELVVKAFSTRKVNLNEIAGLVEIGIKSVNLKLL